MKIFQPAYYFKNQTFLQQIGAEKKVNGLPFLFIATVFLMILSSGCSLSKSLPEGETLYKGAAINYEKKEKKQDITKLETAMSAAIENPRPNKKLLGIRLKLRLYNLFYTTKEKGLKQWLMKKLGEPPVIYDEAVTKQTKSLLENRANNHGYFETSVSSKGTTKNRKTKVEYTVKVYEPYLMDTLKNIIKDSLLHIEIAALQDSSLLKPNQRYDLALLKQERQRIALKLREKGYYYFQDDFLLFRADTTQERHHIEMELRIKKETPPRSMQPQIIRKVVVYPDYDLKRPTQPALDTLREEEMIFIYDDLLLSPNEMHKAILLEAGKIYNGTMHQRTLERLSNMQMYQYIDVQFVKVKNQDTLVDVRIYLTPRKKRTIEGSLGASYTNSVSFGPEISLNYTNRNLFKGAELLKINGTATYAFPLSSQVLTTEEQRIEVELLKPRVWFPARQILNSKRLIGNTSFKAEFSRQQIQLPLRDLESFLEESNFTGLLEELNRDTSYAPRVGINAVTLSFGYNWRVRPTIRHQIIPFELTLQLPKYETEELRNLFLLLASQNTNRNLGLNFEKMVIYKPSYTFLYDSRFKNVKQHNYYYRWRLGYSINKLLDKNSFVNERVLEGQFLTLENDGRYYLKPNAKTTFAFRIAPGIAYPLKNEVILPFFDLFVVGGPNSVRAFQPRRVGPGQTEPTNENFFFVGTGDLRLETSFEIRHKITSLLEVAAFVDAGNTWLVEGNGQDDPAVFNFQDFYQELATGAGLGVRLDFEILLLRLDLAYPLTKPWLPEGQRFVGDKFSFGELNFNLAFGYPF